MSSCPQMGHDYCNKAKPGYKLLHAINSRPYIYILHVEVVSGECMVGGLVINLEVKSRVREPPYLLAYGVICSL